MRADRLVSLALLLQARGRTSAHALAAELEVSVRTVYRDIAALNLAGVPVVTESGPGGGCWLLDGYRFPLRGLSGDEAAALLVLGVPAVVAELGLAQALAAAQDKIRLTSGALAGTAAAAGGGGSRGGGGGGSRGGGGGSRGSGGGSRGSGGGSRGSGGGSGGGGGGRGGGSGGGSRAGGSGNGSRAGVTSGGVTSGGVTSGGDDGPASALVHLDMPRWFGGSEPVPWLRTLAAAVHDRRQLRLGYRRGSTDDETTRVVCPLGLVNKAGTWYLVAAGEERAAGGERAAGWERAAGAAGGERAAGGGGNTKADHTVFRVGRVTSAHALAEAFARPPGFDLAGFWRGWSDSFMSSRPKLKVLVRASPNALAVFPEVYGDAVRKALEAAPPADAHGFRDVTLTFEHEAAAVQRLAGFGGGVEVLSPIAVRDRLIATARELLERYQIPL